MIKIQHLATEKLLNDTKRLTFEIQSGGYTDFECELVIDLRWLFGILHEIFIGEYHLQKDSFKETFHIDVANKIANRSSRFNWQSISFLAFRGNYVRTRGNGKIVTTHR